MMNKQKAIQQKEEGQLVREDLIREVLKGAPSGVDPDSIVAAAALLLDVETTKAMIHLLQIGKLFGRLDDDGEVQLRVGDVSCDGPTKAEAA